jgi:hypothetical protein
LHGGFQFTPDPEAVAGRHPVQGIGGGQRAGLSERSRTFARSTSGTLQGLFEQVLEMALEVGAVKVGRVSLDGTKIKANASKHKAMSYGRMEEKQQQLKEEVKQLLEHVSDHQKSLFLGLLPEASNIIAPKAPSSVRSSAMGYSGESGWNTDSAY